MAVITDLEYEIILSPNNYAARYTLANAYSATGQHGMSHITLGHLYVAMDDVAQAQKHLNIAKQMLVDDSKLKPPVKDLEMSIEIALRKSKPL